MASEPILDTAGPATVGFGAFTLNIDARKLFDAENREIELTSMEFDLLKAFADNPNRVLERDRLSVQVGANGDLETFARLCRWRATR